MSDNETGMDRAEEALPTAEPKVLNPAAQRALAEAEARRRAIDDKAVPAGEQGGRGGLDPVRYGDWEIKGLTSDF